MNDSKKGLVIKSIIMIGLIVSFAGFSMHFMNPATGKSTNALELDAQASIVLPIQSPSSGLETQFYIDITIFDPSSANWSIAHILSSEEYIRYLNGSPINNLGLSITFENSTSASYVQLFDDAIDFYIVLSNLGNDSSFWFVYYSITPSTYFPSLLVGFMGLFVISIALILYFTGWKRYFMGGLTINLCVFLIRIFTLTTYSLNLPSVFEDFIHIELYNDYQFFYLNWIPELFSGTMPYSNGMHVYLYPPLWIYTVSLLGFTPPWLPGLILFLFNVLTGIIIYRIGRILFDNERIAIFAMLLYLLNPLTLLYGSFMWLNPTIFVFFVVLSFQQALEHNERNAIIALAIATLFKQFAVIFFPIISLIFIKTNNEVGSLKGVVRFVKHTAIYAGIVGIVSLPFLLLSFDIFIQRMFIISSSIGIYEFVPGLSIPVHINTFFLWLKFPQWFTNIVGFLLAYYIFLIVSGIIIYFSYRSYKPEITQVENPDIHSRLLFAKALLWSFVLVAVVQTFYPRGSYKFYLLALVPFAVLLFDYKNLSWDSLQSFHFSRRHAFVPIMLLLIFICFRYVYLWILAAWSFFYLWKSGDLRSIKNTLKRLYPKSKIVIEATDHL